MNLLKSVRRSEPICSSCSSGLLNLLHREVCGRYFEDAGMIMMLISILKLISLSIVNKLIFSIGALLRQSILECFMWLSALSSWVKRSIGPLMLRDRLIDSP